MDYNPLQEKGRKEVTFVVYEGIIKSVAPIIVQEINEKYHAIYKDLLDLDRLVGYKSQNYHLLAIQRTERNILRYLPKDQAFDWEELYDQLTLRDAAIYTRSVPLDIAESLLITTSQRFNKQTYIYHPVYDPRIHQDLSLSGVEFTNVSM